jgi:hypothetical protein
MKTKPNHQLVAAVALLSTCILQPATLLAQGSLTPPGAPAPTMKTLQQVEPRVPISSAPFTISQPGSYYLTTNLTVSGGNAITIATNGVTLDLNGFTIASTAPSATGYGIYINSGLRNLTILNGVIQGGVTNDGSGIFSGPGFAYGIYYSGSAPQNVQVRAVSVSGCQNYGIYVGSSESTTVENCVVRTVGGHGIYASIILGCVALDCGGTAIYGQQVSDSRGESAGGTGLYAGTAQNCYGSSSSGTGLSAQTAQNCYGVSSSGYGLYANLNAIGCSGSSTSGTGLYAQTAQNCYGTSSSYYGLYAYTAQNCCGLSTSGTGLYAWSTAIGCYGQSSSGLRGLYAQNAAFCIGSRIGGRAIEANIANGCWASGGTNLITYKYNMP